MAAVVAKLRIGDLNTRAVADDGESADSSPAAQRPARFDNKRAETLKLLMRQFLTHKSVCNSRFVLATPRIGPEKRTMTATRRRILATQDDLATARQLVDFLGSRGYQVDRRSTATTGCVSGFPSPMP